MNTDGALVHVPPQAARSRLELCLARARIHLEEAERNLKRAAGGGMVFPFSTGCLLAQTLKGLDAQLRAVRSIETRFGFGSN